jgi:hypothetical protein
MVLTVWKYVPEEQWFVQDKVVDTASSVIWCERYQKPGEFELQMRATPELLRYFIENEVLLTRTDTDRVMLPERMVLKTSAESGDTLTISGKSGEGIPGRRTITQDTTMHRHPNGAALLYYLMQENIASYWYYHTDARHPGSGQFRYMPFFVVGNVVELPDDVDIRAQPFGENLGTFTETVCSACDIGFRVRFDGGTMFYEFYRGEDRSGTVIFSSDFQNLGDTEYSFDRRTYFNRVMIATEGEGKDRVKIQQTLHDSARAEGFTLREFYMDDPQISSNTLDESGNPIDGVMYSILLAKMAITELRARKEEIRSDGEILPNGQFRYRRDYFLGDTVSVRNAYGIRGKAVVTEVTEVEDESGSRVIPKFSEWVV